MRSTSQPSTEPLLALPTGTTVCVMDADDDRPILAAVLAEGRH